MVQFKDVFLGTDKRRYVRAASVQACLPARRRQAQCTEQGLAAIDGRIAVTPAGSWMRRAASCGSGYCERTGCPTVFLTSLGGAAFGNPLEWIDAVRARALEAVGGCDPDVRLVRFGQPKK